MRDDVHPPSSAVREVVARALAEDVLPLGDLTASLVPIDVHARAAFIARAAGVVAGRLCAIEAFTQVDDTVVLAWSFDDGDSVEPGDVLGVVTGPLRSVLTAERTALNLLSHLSGVATATRRYAELAAPARIRDTRKTTPGLRALEKAAVRAGGGVNHRANLSDGILVKDNHLGGLTIAEAVRKADERWPGRVVEVECDSIEQVQQALDAGAGMVLLDNMTPDEVADCVRLVGGSVPVEVSGGVTLDNVASYAPTGADFIAVGAITHSATVLDIGLDLELGG
ncbi:MAG TPA: carboxylating nicotinate-nucleotide diphosphorylase [Acidimicrobiales bacterium]|nr:carboxylating nicotinate-nucleotide diphosphorylase [Acidimicrobiales bacterium]